MMVARTKTTQVLTKKQTEKKAPPPFTITREDVEALALGTHSKQFELERTLVLLAREGGLAGVNKKPARYSASTIQNFADCKRKFYWATVAGLEEAGSKAQAFGTKLHAYQERYLKTGELPPRHDAEGILANIGLIALPKPMTPGLQIEQPFEMHFDGIPVAITGTRDFAVDATDVSATRFLLGDHKTARSSRYPKTPEWLKHNIQANLYAYTKWTELHAKGFDRLKEVEKQWVYYFKEERRVDSIRSLDSLSFVGDQFEGVIRPLVIEMASIAKEAPKVSDIPPPDDRSVCEMYGGCKHRARCFGFGQGASQMGVIAKSFSQSSIAAKAAASVPATSAPVTAKGAGAAINPPPAPAPRVVAKKTAPPPPPPAEDFVDENGLPCDENGEAFVDADGVRCDKEGNPLEGSAPAEAPEAQQEAPAAATEKPKRQRRAKETAQISTQGGGELPQAPPAAARAPTGSRTAPGFNSGHDFWLFVDCGPVKGVAGEIALAETLAGAAQALAATRLGTGHYREGKDSYGVLETTFAQWLEENAVVGYVRIDTATIISRDIIGLLRAHAAIVIQK